MSHAGTWDGYHSLPVSECIDAGHDPLVCLNAPSVEEAYELFQTLQQQLVDVAGAPEEEVYGTGTVASHGTNADYRDREWQPGAVYSQGKPSENSPCFFVPISPNTLDDHVISSAACPNYNGLDVPEIGGRHFAVGETASDGITTAQIVDDLSTAKRGEYVGVTIHAYEYRDVDDMGSPSNDRDLIDDLFLDLNRSGYGARLISEVLDTESPCTVGNVCA